MTKWPVGRRLSFFSISEAGSTCVNALLRRWKYNKHFGLHRQLHQMYTPVHSSSTVVFSRHSNLMIIKWIYPFNPICVCMFFTSPEWNIIVYYSTTWIDGVLKHTHTKSTQPNFIRLYLFSSERWVGVQRIVLPFTWCFFLSFFFLLFKL